MAGEITPDSRATSPGIRSRAITGSRWRPTRLYDVAEFVAALRQCNITPHVAQNTSNRRSAIDGRTTRHLGYAVSVRRRKRIEEIFGWPKATRGAAPDPSSRSRPCGVDFYLHRRRLQPGPPAPAIGYGGVNMPGVCPNVPQSRKITRLTRANRSGYTTNEGIRFINSTTLSKIKNLSTAC
jgi:hypothetical protein